MEKGEFKGDKEGKVRIRIKRVPVSWARWPMPVILGLTGDLEHELGHIASSGPGLNGKDAFQKIKQTTRSMSDPVIYKVIITKETM